MNWSKEESLRRDEIEKIQLQRLQETIQLVYSKVPWYKQKMDGLGVVPEDIKSLADLSRLPLTSKYDMRETYPFGMFASDQEDIVRLHASSGTTGKPVVVGYTKNDLELWSDLLARGLTAAGLGRKDVVQNSYGYGLFTGGMGFHYAAERINATVVPISGGNTKKQIDLLNDFKSTALMCTPSYAFHIGEVLNKNPEIKEKLKLRVAMLGAEPWTEQMRKEIEEMLGVKAFDIYGLSEIMGPGVGFECEHKSGLHINEDCFIPEIIDPVTLEPKAPGEEGELVITTIKKEGIPVIRYRTRDLTRLHYETCECGRTFVRMERCKGRSDDMLIIRGVNLFPSQVESALYDLNITTSQFNLHVNRDGAMDTIKLVVESKEVLNGNKVDVGNKVKRYLKDAVGLSFEIDVVDPHSLERFEGKSKRVFDNR